MSERPVRIVIADDHAIFRAGLRQLLGTHDRCQVVGEAADGLEAVTRVDENRADLLLLDFAMPGSNGLAALRELQRRGTPVRTVMLTAEIDPSEVVECLKRGAAGVLLKSAATDLLFKCIDQVMQGQYWIDRGATGNLVSALRHYETAETGRHRAIVQLTSREREIVSALLAGKSNKAIAQDLGIAEQTVKNHLSQLYDKLRVTSRLELAVAVRALGFVDAC